MASHHLLRLLALFSLLCLALGALLPPGQTPLVSIEIKDHSANSHNGVAVLEISRWELFGNSLFFTNIAVGTPAQPFKLILDLEFGGVVVRGKDCHDCGERDVFYYDKSASSTCEDPNLHFSSPPWAGPLLRDNLQLASLMLPNSSFGAADWFEGDWNMILAHVSDG